LEPDSSWELSSAQLYTGCLTSPSKIIDGFASRCTVLWQRISPCSNVSDKDPNVYTAFASKGFSDPRLIGPMLLFLVLLVGRWRNDRP
jgi:hypothetical protein